MRDFNAWAMDLAHLAQLEQWGVDPIELHADDGTVWRATVADFRAYGFNLKDYGHGAQRALAVSRWQHIRPGEPFQPALF